MHLIVPNRISRLELQKRSGLKSARQADLELLSVAPKEYLDTTHFDTVRFPPPSWASEVFKKAALDGTLAYTPYRGNEKVLEKLGESITAFMGTQVAQENLILVPGSQAALFVSLSSIVEKGSKVALMSPDYLFNARILEFLNANICYIPIHQSSTQPSPDLERLEYEFANGCKTFLFSNPNNPTGYVYKEHELKQIAEMAIKYDITIIVDALYSRLLHKGHSYTHLNTLPGMKERVISILGPSKTESLSGYRLGVIVAPDYLMPRLENVLSIMALRAPAYAQHLLSHWLSEDKDWVNALLPEFTNLQTLTIEAFKQLSWIKIEPQNGTAYAWPDISALEMDDLSVAKHILKDSGVFVSPGYQFGPWEEGHFRVCYAREEKEWEKALERIVSVLHNLAVINGRF